MEQELLKKLRIIVPGCIIFLAILSAFVEKIPVKYLFSQATMTIASSLIVIVIVCVLGAVYHLSHIRYNFNGKALDKIDSNIKLSLLEPFKNDREIFDQSTRLKKGRTLMDIFYHIVDHDESLTAKAKNVRFNGIFLSSTADLIPISFFGIVINFIAYEIWKSDYHIVVIFVWLGICILGYFLLPKVTERHIELSNEQLGSIKTNHSKELKEKIGEAIKLLQNNGRKS